MSARLGEELGEDLPGRTACATPRGGTGRPRTADGDSRAATGATSDVAVAMKPSGTRAMPSKWLIHTVWSSGWSARQAAWAPIRR